MFISSYIPQFLSTQLTAPEQHEVLGISNTEHARHNKKYIYLETERERQRERDELSVEEGRIEDMCRCARKYGDDWVKYRQIVKYVFIPYVF